jgi:hypothetical protein
MARYKFSGKLQELIDRAEIGNNDDVDYIMSHLTSDSTFAMTRYVDYALSLVENKNGISQIEYYLFNGTLIQRNYCCLFFNRRNNWDIVNLAYKQGLIDEIQAFSR